MIKGWFTLVKRGKAGRIEIPQTYCVIAGGCDKRPTRQYAASNFGQCLQEPNN